jgi:predicted aminopeptidase
MDHKRNNGRVKKALRALFLLCAAAVVSGCQTWSYYTQAVKGQYQILAHQQPVDRLIADPQTSARLKAQLELLQKLRHFAQIELKLPVDGHYRKYADVHRPYVVWNVQAAPQFSLQPKTWWYPFVGSLEYHGYFSECGARERGRRLQAKGWDVCVDGVEAYSTLGWFKDPVLNTFVDRPEPELAEVIFHELGHQRVFASGDTDFNEAFATTVGQAGARRWLRATGNTNLLDRYDASLRRNDQFVRLMMNARGRLEAIYGDTLDEQGKVKAAKKPPAAPERLRTEKERVFGDLRRDYAELKSQWGGGSAYDDWFTHELNNARLNTIANYYDEMPGFEQLLRLNGGDLEKFYQTVERLSKMKQAKRHQWLRDLSQGGTRRP